MKKSVKLLFTLILLCGTILIPSLKGDIKESSPQWTITYPRNISSVDGSQVYAWGDRGTEVVQTSDGGYAIFAHIDDHYLTGCDSRDSYSMQLIKTDANGQLQWRKTLPQITACRSVLQTSDGGFIIVADPSSGSNTLFKFDASGNFVWSKNIHFYAYCVTAANDSGYYLAGTNDGYAFATIAKFDADGNMLWSRVPNGDGSAAYAVVALPDGGAAIVGSINNVPRLCIYDSQGHQQLEKQFPQFSGGLSDSGSRFTSIINVDGGLVLSGYASENNAGSPIGHGLIVKVDYQGNITMSQTYNDPSNPADQYFGFTSLIATTDGGYIATSGSAIFKVNSDGSVLWYLTSASDVTNQLGSIAAVAASSDGGFVVTGGKGDSVWLAKFPQTVQATPTPTEVTPNQPATQLFNPITAIIIVSLVAVIWDCCFTFAG